MEGLTIVKKMEKEEAKKLASLNLDKVGLADRADYFPEGTFWWSATTCGNCAGVIHESKDIIIR